MNGEGVAKIDGKIALVPYALIDETCEVKIKKDHSNYAECELEKVTKSSSNRVVPPCPYFYECGGCNLQHMTYDEQLKYKTLLVKKTIKKVAGIECEVLNTVPSLNQYNYRNKMSFAFNNNFIGFFKNNSNSVIDIKTCKLASENINKLLSLAREYFAKFPQRDLLKNIVIREINNQILVGVVAKKNLELSDFYRILTKNFNKIGLFLIINKRNDSVVLTNNQTHIDGIKAINITNFGINYSVDLLGFHQTNIDIQNKIYSEVLNLISNNTCVVNGFSGEGLLSAILSKKAKHVTGIEINQTSHQSAEKLKKENNLSNLTNILGDFNKHITPLKSKADTLILDPPKKGIGQQFLKTLVGIKEIIYISCNPIALSKDLRFLKEFYTIEKVEPFDMFPNTNNVETVVKLTLK